MWRGESVLAAVSTGVVLLVLAYNYYRPPASLPVAAPVAAPVTNPAATPAAAPVTTPAPAPPTLPTLQLTNEQIHDKLKSRGSSVSSSSILLGENDEIRAEQIRLALKALNLLVREKVIDAQKRSRLKQLILAENPSPHVIHAVEEFELQGDAARFLAQLASL